MGCFFVGPGAAGGFFLSSWFTMVFWGIVSPHVDIRTIDYPLAMVVTIGLWLILAPCIIAVVKKQGKRWGD